MVHRYCMTMLVRCFSLRSSKIDVSTFEDRCVDFRRSMWFGDRCGDLRRSTIDVSTFEDQRSMCRPSKIDVSTFRNRCVDLQRSMIDVLTIEDQCSMCRPSRIHGRCEIMLLHLLKNIDTIVVYMRITPRVCTSVLSLFL